MKQKTLTLQDKANIICEVLKQRPGNGFRISLASTDIDFERLIISAGQIDFHKHDIKEIEKRADIELSWIHYWHEPDFCEKHPQMPKHMRRYTDGKHIEIMFVKDLRKEAIN